MNADNFDIIGDFTIEAKIKINSSNNTMPIFGISDEIAKTLFENNNIIVIEDYVFLDNYHLQYSSFFDLLFAQLHLLPCLIV